MNTSKEEKIVAGQRVGKQNGLIKIFWVSPDQICYTCTLCDQDSCLDIDEYDRHKTWFSFECKNCGDATKRMVNLRRVLGIKEEEEKEGKGK